VIEDIFQRRAEQLARPLAEDAGVDRAPVLVFTLGAIEFGMELSTLAEVFPYRGCTPVNGGHAALLGVVSVRGDIRVVVDLGRLLDVPVSGGRRGYVLMARKRDRFVALRVDAIADVRRVESARLNAAGSARPSTFVKAFVDEAVRVVDIDAVVTALGIALD
jgi:purine-binding chemotaxis protein CheW